MTDLRLLPLLEATRPGHLHPSLASRLEGIGPLTVEARRLDPPTAYTLIYQAAAQRLVLKGFFAQHHYLRYAGRLALRHADQVGHLRDGTGGLDFVPELNAVLWSFPFDPVLSQLRRCVDTRWVANQIGQADVPLRADLLRYRPEQRALIAYRDAESKAVSCYGKVAPNDSNEVVYQVMRTLGASRLEPTGRLTLARPLAFVPEANLLLQAPAPGRAVTGDRNRSQFLELARLAGAALAGLHRADLRVGPEQRFADNLKHLNRAAERVGLVAPTLHQPLRRIIGQLQSRCRRSMPGPSVPSHGDYKYDQFLFDDATGTIALIDFELFCQAEAALDLGTFCAYLPLAQPRDWREAAAVELLRATFLAAYEQAAGARIDLARFSLFESAILASRALSQAWRQRPGWRQSAPRLLDLALERLVNPAALGDAADFATHSTGHNAPAP